MTPLQPSKSNEPVDLMAELEKSLEPSGTCAIHGDYWTDRCRRCSGYAMVLDDSNSTRTPFR